MVDDLHIDAMICFPRLECVFSVGYIRESIRAHGRVVISLDNDCWNTRDTQAMTDDLHINATLGYPRLECVFSLGYIRESIRAHGRAVISLDNDCWNTRDTLPNERHPQGMTLHLEIDDFPVFSQHIEIASVKNATALLLFPSQMVGIDGPSLCSSEHCVVEVEGAVFPRYGSNHSQNHVGTRRKAGKWAWNHRGKPCKRSKSTNASISQ